MNNKTMKKRQEYDRIRDMLRSFFRRWFILNRLYHYTVKIRGFAQNWVRRDNFIDWITGVKQQGRPPEWGDSKLKPSRVNKLARFLFSSDIIDSQIKEINETIDECAERDTINRKPEMIKITGLGLDEYSVSYIIFGHDYARKIWTGVIVGLLVWFASERFKTIVPPTIEVRPIVNPAAESCNKK